MEWLTENLGKLLPLIIAVLYILSSLKSRGKSEDEEEDPGAAERARKIQEEIRRKILERQQKSQPASAQPDQEEAAPSLRESGSDQVLRPEEPKSARDVVPPPLESHVQPPAIPAYDAPRSTYADLFEEQRRKIDEELKKAREIRKQTIAAPVVDRRFPSRGESAELSLRSSLLKDLRQPDSLRKAIVLKEILDAPVGLR